MYSTREEYRIADRYDYEEERRYPRTISVEKDQLWDRLNYDRAETAHYDSAYRTQRSPARTTRAAEPKTFEYNLPVGGYYDDYRPQEVMPKIREESKVSAPKKTRLSAKVKTLIAVYFVIIVVITTLVLINAIPGSSAQTGTNGAYQGTELSEEAIRQTANGDTLYAAGAGEVTTDSKTGFFEKICNWIENLAR